ncbi:MAG TPA: hypothetical protein PKY70_05640 [Nakamurella multipartita]|nr:hypothetical protein [Nakamurella multipartita]
MLDVVGVSVTVTTAAVVLRMIVVEVTVTTVVADGTAMDGVPPVEQPTTTPSVARNSTNAPTRRSGRLGFSDGKAEPPPRDRRLGAAHPTRRDRPEQTLPSHC